MFLIHLIFLKNHCFERESFLLYAFVSLFLLQNQHCRQKIVANFPMMKFWGGTEFADIEISASGESNVSIDKWDTFSKFINF